MEGAVHAAGVVAAAAIVTSVGVLGGWFGPVGPDHHAPPQAAQPGPSSAPAMPSSEGDPAPSATDEADQRDGQGASSASNETEPVVVRPGIEIFPPHGCTLGFLARNATGGWYGFTAGHCIDRDGQAVTVDDNGTAVQVGRVIAHNESSIEGEIEVEDWALIRFRDHRSRMAFEPAVTNWTGPTGADTPPVAFDDVVCAYGHGFDQKFERYRGDPARCGRFDHWGYNAQAGAYVDGWFEVKMRANAGDSGAPLVHHPSGRALGIVLNGELYGHEGFLRSQVDGHTACALLYYAHRAGYPLSLATAQYDPPPPTDEGPPMLVQEPHEQGMQADDMCDELREIRSG